MAADAGTSPWGGWEGHSCEIDSDFLSIVDCLEVMGAAWVYDPCYPFGWSLISVASKCQQLLLDIGRNEDILKGR